MQHFFNRLKSARMEQRKTQDEMALALGVSKRSYCAYEAGETAPSAKLLLALASMQIDIAYLLTGIHANTQKILSQVHAASQAASRLGGTHQEQAHVAEAMVDKYQVVPLSPRQRALLDNWEHADEAGKKVIESTASFAAQPRAAQGGQ